MRGNVSALSACRPVGVRGKRVGVSAFARLSNFVEKVEFITSAGFLNGGNERGLLGIPGAGPKAVITDLGVLTPDPQSKELVLTQIHPGITFEQVRAATGWDLRASRDLATTEEPAIEDLRVLRDLKQRTEAAHAG